MKTKNVRHQKHQELQLQLRTRIVLIEIKRQKQCTNNTGKKLKGTKEDLHCKNQCNMLQVLDDKEIEDKAVEREVKKKVTEEGETKQDTSQSSNVSKIKIEYMGSSKEY